LSKDSKGNNALHLATLKSNVESVAALIQMQFPLDDRMANGVNALGIAIYNHDA
jgi:ankyrin repeat protein